MDYNIKETLNNFEQIRKNLWEKQYDGQIQRMKRVLHEVLSYSKWNQSNLKSVHYETFVIIWNYSKKIAQPQANEIISELHKEKFDLATQIYQVIWNMRHEANLKKESQKVAHQDIDRSVADFSTRAQKKLGKCSSVKHLVTDPHFIMQWSKRSRTEISQFIYDELWLRYRMSEEQYTKAVQLLNPEMIIKIEKTI